MDETINIITSREDVLKNNVAKGAKRKSVNKDDWKRGIAKKNRTKGDEYVSLTSGNTIPAKKFKFINSRCINNCHGGFPMPEQKKLFDSFYALQSKECQDVYLSSCLALKGEPHSKVVNPKIKKKHFWNYSLKNNGCSVTVCRVLLLGPLQVTPKKLE